MYFYSPREEASCELYKSHCVYWSDHCAQAVLLKAPTDRGTKSNEEMSVQADDSNVLGDSVDSEEGTRPHRREEEED